MQTTRTEFRDPTRLRVLLASMLGVGMCQMTLVNATFGVFIAPLQDAFAWSRAQLSLALALATVAIALMSPMTGRLIDRYGARQVVMASALLFGCIFSTLFALTGSLAHFYGIFLLAGIAGAGTNAIAYARVISACFDRSRGLALGLAMSGVGLTSAVLPLFAQWLISDWSWRVAYPVLAITAMCCMLMAGWMIGGHSVTAAPRPAGVGASQALRRTSFWRNRLHLFTVLSPLDRRHFLLLLVFVLLLATAVNGGVIHLFPFLTDIGQSPGRAALYMGLLGLGLAIGKLVTGILVDRFFAPRVASGVFALVAIALFALQVEPDGVVLATSVFVLGLGAAALASLTAYLASRYFLAEAFGEVYGYLYGALIMGTALGPLLMGLVHDVTGSYLSGFLSSALVVALVAAGFSSLGVYPSIVSADTPRVADA